MNNFYNDILNRKNLDEVDKTDIETCSLYAIIQESLQEAEEQFADYLKDGDNLLNAVRKEAMKEFAKAFSDCVEWNIKRTKYKINVR